MTVAATERGRAGRLLPAAAAAATGILVGAATVATRAVVDQAGPVTLALLRYAIGVGCLLPPVLLAPRVRFAPRDLLAIALLGLVGVALGLWLAYRPAHHDA